MGQVELCLLDLPAPVQSLILGHLPAEEPVHFANALLACKALRQAGEAVPHRAPLKLTYVPNLGEGKLIYIRRLGYETELLALLTRKAQLWRAAVVDVGSLADLRLLLGSLSTPAGSGLRRLNLVLATDTQQNPQTDPCLRIPEVGMLLLMLCCVGAGHLAPALFHPKFAWPQYG